MGRASALSIAPVVAKRQERFDHLPVGSDAASDHEMTVRKQLQQTRKHLPFIRI